MATKLYVEIYTPSAANTKKILVTYIISIGGPRLSQRRMSAAIRSFFVCIYWMLTYSYHSFISYILPTSLVHYFYICIDTYSYMCIDVCHLLECNYMFVASIVPCLLINSIHLLYMCLSTTVIYKLVYKQLSFLLVLSVRWVYVQRMWNRRLYLV